MLKQLDKNVVKTFNDLYFGENFENPITSNKSNITLMNTVNVNKNEIKTIIL